MGIIDANALTRVGHVSFDYSDTCTMPQVYILMALAFLGGWYACYKNR